MEQKKRPLILIVDDTPYNVQVLSGILYEKGYNVSISTSGKQAINSVKRQLPDLMLLDIQMPEMNGFEVCEIIKSDIKTNEFPIIFLTASIEPDNITKGLKLGAVDYITKPFNVEELLARVATHIELKLTREKLTELVATKDKFLTIIAHDLRNPMGTIMGFSELLVKNFDNYDKEKIKKFAGHIFSSVNETFKLLENLLEWSQLQIGAMHAEMQMSNMKDITEEVIALLKETAKIKNININNNINTDLYVRCDRNMIKTIFRNLISNSIKFTENGGTVWIDYAQQATDLVFKVKDTGIGISSEISDQLFRIEYNVSTLGTSGEKGTGLGLLLCKELIEKQDGKIWLESKENQGSTFWFNLLK